MYAIIETGGKQYKVEAGDVIFVEKLGADDDSEYTFEKLKADPENIKVIQGIRVMNNLTAVYSFIESVYIYNGTSRYVYSTSDLLGTNDEIDRFGDRTAAEIFMDLDQYPKLSPFFRKAEFASPRGNKNVYSYIY